MIVPATAVLAVLLGAVVLSRPSDGAGEPAGCPATLVPAYVLPEALTDFVDASPGPVALVVNPANGPGTEPDDGYRRAIRDAHDRGMTVLGYVPTGYGERPATAVDADVDRYASWYDADGIFFDEAASDPRHLAHYRELGRHARSAVEGLIVLNAGTVPDRAYFGVADVIVTFEGPAADYERAIARTPDWLDALPARRIAHLIYDAPEDRIREIASRPVHAGFVYATTGRRPNPWGVLSAAEARAQDEIRRCD
jgi:hypothetical protein